MPAHKNYPSKTQNLRMTAVGSGNITVKQGVNTVEFDMYPDGDVIISIDEASVVVNPESMRVLMEVYGYYVFQRPTTIDFEDS